MILTEIQGEKMVGPFIYKVKCHVLQIFWFSIKLTEANIVEYPKKANLGFSLGYSTGVGADHLHTSIGNVGIKCMKYMKLI